MTGIKRNTSTLLQHSCFITNMLVLRRARIIAFWTNHRRIKWMHKFSLGRLWHFRLGSQPVAKTGLCFRCRWQLEVWCSMNRTRSQISKYCENTGLETVVSFDITVSPNLMLEFFDCRCHSHHFKWKLMKPLINWVVLFWIKLKCNENLYASKLQRLYHQWNCD